MDKGRAKVALGMFSAIVVAAVALWYVTAPPKGVDGYRERAAATAETLVSQLETARLWAEFSYEQERGDALRLGPLRAPAGDRGAAGHARWPLGGGL